MARQHHHDQDARRRTPRPRPDTEERTDDPRTPLSLRHDAARRRADHRRRFLARGQATHRGACSTGSASITSRAAIPAPIRSTPSSSRTKPTKRARFCAFGMTKRAGRSAANDPGVAGLLAADADAIVFVAKSWDYHVHVALGCTLEENLECIAESVQAAVAAGREAMVDCEHFFDGYKANPDYALACAQAGDRGRRALGGAVRHQRRHAAARDRAHRRRGRARHPRRPARHPRPQRHRQRGRQFARRHPRRRAAGAGHAERPRRALRQRQSRLADPDAGAEARIRRALRDRRRRPRRCARSPRSRAPSTNC